MTHTETHIHAETDKHADTLAYHYLRNVAYITNQETSVVEKSLTALLEPVFFIALT